MMTALLLVGLACPAVEVIADPEVPWSKVDEWSLAAAEVGCRRRYGPRACLVRFERVGFQDYRATCRRNGRA